MEDIAGRPGDCPGAETVPCDVLDLRPTSDRGTFDDVTHAIWMQVEFGSRDAAYLIDGTKHE
jgi:hypothetical protein